MKTILAWIFGVATTVGAHTWTPGDTMAEREELRTHILEEWQRSRMEVASTAASLQLAAAAMAAAADAPETAKPFLPFKRLDLRADGEFLYVGSNGLPDHPMMIGITAWQQQVPLPQSYFGDNAWRIPLKPVPAAQPAMIQGRFLRGAIALAVNGIPIFNPQNNRGEVSYEIGELDRWGGHCGRADDYHYHIAPLHLEAIVGKGEPVAFGLDGYPVLGLTEADGLAPRDLDECHGHEHDGQGYHYHASMKYPYVFGGFHGEVVEADGQVDPQPRAQPIREALPPLRGAEITGFESTGSDSYKLSYEVNDDKRSVSYSIKADGTFPFHFDNGREGTSDEVYTARRQGGGGGSGRPPGGGPEGMKGKGKGKGKGGREGEMRRDDPPPPRPGEESGRPPRPQAAIEGILDVNGDGVVTAQEFTDNAKSNATKKGVAIPEAMARAKEQFNALDHNRDGKLDTPELDELAGNAPVTGAPQPRGEEPPAREEMKKGGGGERGGKGQAFVALPDQPRSSDGKFMLNSPVVEDLQTLPVEFTGDGDGISPPLAWTGAPAGTKGYALIMDHVTPDGDRKWYWTVYDIPSNALSLPKNVTDIGKLGTGFKGEIGYEPPHSKGPGAKTYVITLYALSEPLKVTDKPGREELITAMNGKVLANSSLRVVHSSRESPDSGGNTSVVKNGEQDSSSTRNFAPATSPPNPPTTEQPKGRNGGKGKGGPPGLVKPSIADTIKLNVYADNWFMLYVNGRLVAVDPIQFTPHNVVSVDFLPEYPMTIAVLAKDNADPKTGLEYGTSIGDGGFILKFGDGTVTNATWKAKNFFHGPVNGDTENPQVKHEELPANWWAVDFDDSAWQNAKEYTVEEVDPKQPYFENDFEGAKFIWTDDLALDNTILFRTKIEKPGWTPRWNTKPDLDVSGVPMR
ncbi:MAG: YHYH protein [Verrucomicrobiales bacterium]|nr:YHYH protein [Verrucomicrobiales bacterium]